MEASVRITCAFFFGIDGISDIHSGIRDCKLEWELFKKIDGRYLLARIVPNGQYSGMWRLAVLNPGYILPISYLTTYKNLSRIIERPYIRCDAEEVFRLKISGEHILRFPTNFSGMTIEHLIDVALDANEADNREFLTANSSKNEFIGYMPSYTSYTPMSFNDDGTVTAARVEDEGCEKEINSTIEQMRDSLPLLSNSSIVRFFTVPQLHLKSSSSITSLASFRFVICQPRMLSSKLKHRNAIPKSMLNNCIMRRRAGRHICLAWNGASTVKCLAQF